MPLYLPPGVEGIPFDAEDPDDEDILQYDAASDTWKAVPNSGGSLLGKAIFKIDGGLVYDSNGHPQIKENE